MRPANYQIWQLVVLTVALAGCGRQDEPARPVETPSVPPAFESSTPSPNRDLLDEVHAAAIWFHAKKTRPIWARRLEQPERVQTLEGEEDVPAGNFLCRGEAGDIWPQSAERLEAKYVATDEVADDGWRKYVPHADNTGVLAARIDHPFAVTAKWGELTGKPGDYLVKNYDDRDAPYPDDVWIVDAELFQATYERVEEGVPGFPGK
jgi:hypothetical protein